jgi:kynureninase
MGLARIFHIRSGRKPSSLDVKFDFRKPNVIRVAPTSFHNTFQEVWRFAKILAEHR